MTAGAPTAPPPTWATAGFRALGTGVTVSVTCPDELAAAVAVVGDQLAAVDEACSRFRPDSQLVAVNDADGRPVRVGPLLLAAVDVAVRAARLTGGLVDPTLGGELCRLGYDRDFALVAAGSSAGEAVPAGARVRRRHGWRDVEIDHAGRTVRVPAGLSLDLGATAKAFAADRCAAAAGAALRGGVLVSVGGDLAIGGWPPAGGWPVRVTDDHAGDPHAPGETVAVSSGGLATSSTAVRRWTRGGRPVHHILDPASGRPAPQVWRTVSVTAATCADANTASTAAVVLGHAAPAWLAGRRLPARLVAGDGTVTRVAGWPEPGAGGGGAR